MTTETGTALVPFAAPHDTPSVGELHDFDRYKAIGKVNWSRLKAARTSMLHYYDALVAERPDTEAMRFGRMAHCATLEPMKFPLIYTVAPPEFFDNPRLNRATKEGKAFYARWLLAGFGEFKGDSDGYKAAAFAAENPGREAVSEADYGRAMAIGDSLRRNPEAAAILAAAGRCEVTIEWRDPETGIECKARLDRLTAAGLDADLKTAQSIAYRVFQSQAWKLGYFHQFAFHDLGLRALGIASPNYRWLVAESQRPFDSVVFAPDPEAFKQAQTEVLSLLTRLKWCRENDSYPGQYDGETDRILYAPSYAFPDDDETDDLLIGGL